MRINSFSRDFLDVGRNVITIENYDVLLVRVKAVRHGTTLVIVIKEAYVMLIVVEFVCNRVERNCLRFVANIKIFRWTKIDDLIKVFSTWSLNVITMDFIHPFIGQFFKYFR